MNYQQIVAWLAQDILSTTDSPADAEANTDRYMEDLTDAVQAKVEELKGEEGEEGEE